jgi:hypothetical protein
MRANDSSQLFDGIVYLGEARPAVCESVVHILIKDRSENIVLVLEVEINGTIGDSGLAGDIGDLGVKEPTAGEDFYGGAQNSFIFAVGLPLCRRRASDRYHSSDLEN